LRDRTANVPFSVFLGDVKADRVAAVTVDGDTFTFERRNGGTFETVAPQGYIAANASFVPGLIDHGVRFDVRRAAAFDARGYGAAALILVGGLLIGVVFFRQHFSGRVPTFERLGENDAESVAVTFRDVAGVDEAKDEVREIVDFLKQPARFASIGGRIPRGILLVGPPGTGKTLLARSMAGEAGVPFISASGSDFVEMYAGVGASRVRK